MEYAAGADLGWFFTQWLTRPGYAELATSWAYGAEQVTLRVSQTSRFGAYRMRLPVEVRMADGTTTRHVFEIPAVGEVALTIPGRFTARPTDVRFDPDGDLLAVIR
jgi:aminopeptidase N